MRIELVTSLDCLEIGPYVAFLPGPLKCRHGDEGSVYLHGDVFELIQEVIWDFAPGFDVFGPAITISGPTIDRLAQGLRDFSKRVGGAERPEDLWLAEKVAGPIFDEAENWPENRRALGFVLRDLRRWMLDARARNQPISIS